MTEQNTSIETILDGKQAEAAPETPTVVEAEDKGAARDEKGRFAPKSPEPTGEKPVEAAPPPVAAQPVKPSAPEGYVPLAALVDQRLEAREAKRRAEELQRRISEFEAQKNAQPPVDFFTDPDTALNQRLTPITQRMQQDVSQLRFRASRAEALVEYGKPAIDALEQYVNEASEAGDPGIEELRQRMLASDHPVGTAMQWYNARRILNEVGTDPTAYREKLKAEILAEMQGSGAVAPSQTPAPVMPSNLAGARNVGSRSGPTWSGPKPLADIFKRK